MRRLIYLLPICLFLVADRSKHVDSDLPRPVLPPTLSIPADRSGNAIPCQSEFERLATSDAIAMLKACVARYDREVKGYTTLMQKQERIARKLGPVEEVDVWFRDQPHSVVMKWRNEPLGAGDRVVYVEGSHNNQMVVRPRSSLARKLVGSEVLRDPDGSDARQAGRVSVREFGLRKASERTIAAWGAADKAGRLKVEYRGLKDVPEAGNRKCFVLRRTCDPPEEDGLVTVEIYIDADTWLQVGSVLSDKSDRLVGAYWFRELKLNPEFPADQFDKSIISQ